MTTLQEQFEKDFPDKSVREIDARRKYRDSNFTNYDLDLREYVNLEILRAYGNFADLKRQAEKVKQENNENKKKIKNLDNQLFLKEVEIENLKSEKKGLEQKLTEIDQKSLAKELEQLKNALQNKLDKENYEDLDNLLEAQIEFAKSSNSYAQRQITKIQQKLIKTGKMNEKELQNLSQIQDKLTKLETQLEAKIEINC